MRKIKFKALRTDDKGWIYGDLWQLEESVWISRVELNYEVKPSTVCQYVCEDADENEVYVGDIVTYGEDSTEYVVGYSEFKRSFLMRKLEGRFYEYPVYAKIYQTGKNIHNAK